MTILIDTQVLIWLGDGSPRLGAKARTMLDDRTHNILVSYFSFFEVAIKATTGKLIYDDSVFDDMAAAGIMVVYPSRELLQAYRIQNPNNKDPFDNILLALAEIEQCAFMTSDHKILTAQPTNISLIDARR